MFDLVTTLMVNNFEVNLIHVGDICDQFKNGLDQNLISICKGEYHENDLKYIKIELNDFFEGKKEDPNKLMGAISEFYAHLFFKSHGYTNKFLYLNLEENSMKKGFDGYYLKENDAWILDSKSGSHTTLNISHRQKILEANRSAKEQIEGRTNNNPWRNAFNHANNGDVKAEKTLLKTIQEFSNRYMDKEYATPNELNIILASTIFWFDSWSENTIDDLISELNDIEKNFGWKKVIVFCSNQKTYQDFLDYLKEET